MTTQDRKKLAKAARELASEYAEGRGPELDPTSFCGCAAGEVVMRAAPALNQEAVRWEALQLDKEHGLLLTAATWLIHGIDYNSGNRVARDPYAAVFPLLALATEMDGKIV